MRCTTPDAGDKHDVQDAVLNTMLSFRFLQEKLGLAKHILQQTAEVLSLTTHNVYSPLRYRHTGDHDTNTYRRYHCLIGAEGQVAKRHLSTALCKGRTTHHGTTWSIFQQILQVLFLCCMSRGECFTPCLPLVFGVRRLTFQRPLRSASNRMGRVAITTVHGMPLLSGVMWGRGLMLQVCIPICATAGGGSEMRASRISLRRTLKLLFAQPLLRARDT